MVEIKINGTLVDMFPDTKVSGNYTPVDFAGNEGFEVPYTDTFSIPMTNRNAQIIGFDKNTSTFDNIERNGQVYADGELMFSGVVEIDEASYETLEEMITIRIIDVISYIFNDAKDKSISSIIDAQPFNDKSFIALKNLGLYGYSKYGNSCGVAYIDETGFTDGIKSGNSAGIPVYSYKGRDKGSLPFCFTAKKVLSAIFSKYGLVLNEQKLPYDLINHDVVVSFPMKYMSAALRNTTLNLKTSSGLAYSYTPKNASDAVKDKFNDYPYMSMFVPTSTTIKENNTETFIERKFVRYDPNGVATNTTRKMSIIDAEYVLKPNSITISIENGETLFSISNSDNINSSNISNLSTREFYVYLYHVDSIGNKLGSYKIGEVTFSKTFNSVESVKISDDYLFSDKLKIEAGQRTTIYQALIPKEPCQIFKLEADTKPCAVYEVDTLTQSNDFSQSNATYFVKLNATITADYDVLYGDEHQKHSDYQTCASFFTPKQLSDGTMFCSSKPDGFKNSPITLLNLRESLESTDITISDFLTDFCNRFNCKISSDGVYVYITKIDGDTNDIIDISTRIDSNLAASISDKDSNIRSLQVNNTAYNCFMDKYFDGRAFGSSDPKILDPIKKDDKSITIKSAIMPNIMAGKRRKTQSAEVKELYKHFSDFAYLGYGDYEDFTNSESGIRYAYSKGVSQHFLSLYPTFTYEDNGNSFGSGIVDFIYQPSNSILGSTTMSIEEAQEVGRGSGTINLYSDYGSYNKQLVGTMAWVLKNGALAFNVKMNGNWSDSFYRTEVYTDEFPTTVKAEPVRGASGVCFSYNSYNGISINENVVFTYSQYRKFSLRSISGGSYDGCSFTILCKPYSYGGGIKTIRARAVPFVVGYEVLKDMGTSSVPSESLTLLSNSIKNDNGTLDTLSFNKLGIDKQDVVDASISTAYDKYYKDYEASILSGKSTTIELDVYLDSLEAKRVLSGCRVKLYGQVYTVVSASEIDFSNSYGSIVKLKIAKLK